MRYNWYLLGVRNSFSHTHNARSWYLVRIFFQNSQWAPLCLLYGSPPPPPTIPRSRPHYFTLNQFLVRKKQATRGQMFFLFTPFLKEVLYINFYLFQKKHLMSLVLRFLSSQTTRQLLERKQVLHHLFVNCVWSEFKVTLNIRQTY